MSGFIAIFQRDGRPLARRRLEALTETLTAAAPDGRRVWVDGSVGLGHALLATTEETRREAQPVSLDGEVWIAADARIDGRRELAAELGDRLADPMNPTDAELILTAYEAWGDAAAEHLLGDFAFVLWDRRRRRLLGARDRFGVKPFYYAETPELVVASNSLGCLRRHPAVAAALDERAIGDYLLFDSQLDPERSVFAGVRRLPPAHLRSWHAAGASPRRYWALPIAGEARREPAAGWVERFREIFGSAVRDRLRGDRVAVLMSGGLDSCAVAATAHRALGAPPGSGVHAFTLVYDHLIPDREGRFARLTAESQGFPLHLRRLDDYRQMERWGQLPVAPEPGRHVYDAIYHDLDRAVAEHARVSLTGFGGDPLLVPSTGYLLRQIRRRRWGRAGRYLLDGWRRQRRLPPLGVHTLWRRRRLRRRVMEGYPPWFAADFERRLELRQRWRWSVLERRPEESHPTRPEAYANLWDGQWASLFERADPGARGVPLEPRHPFFDLRVVELLLAMPPVPWCLDKRLLREAMRDILPEEVRRRPKTPLAGEPRHAPARPVDEWWRQQVREVPEVGRFIDTRRVEGLLRGRSGGGFVDPMLEWPLNLAYWLRYSAKLA